MKSLSIDRFISRIKKAVAIFLFPNNYRIYDKKIFGYHNLSFSQEGEDMILSRLFEGKNKEGFYVDVGAHHPQRFSNTYYFYLRGWRGINIDPLPGSMKKFKDIRPFDINIECAIYENEEELIYYQFNEPALNTFTKELADQRGTMEQYHVVDQKKVLCRRLEDILDEYMPQGQYIDFLSVDVEGFDLGVLRSNNWDKYRPYVILVEDLEERVINKQLDSPVNSYLQIQGYDLYAKALNTLFFVMKDEQLLKGQKN